VFLEPVSKQSSILYTPDMTRRQENGSVEQKIELTHAIQKSRKNEPIFPISASDLEEQKYKKPEIQNEGTLNARML